MSIIERISKLEKEAKRLEVDANTRRIWGQQIQDYANDFLEQIQELKAYDGSSEQDVLPQKLSIQNQARPLEEVLEVYKNAVDRNGINPASGAHFGYVPGGGILPTAMGDYLAAISNRYAGLFFANPGSVRIENQLIRWMCKMIGYPSEALGNLCSGGSIANLIAICTARDTKGLRTSTIPQSVVYLTSQVHHCVQKALLIAGLAEIQIRYIPVDETLRMDTTQLSVQIEADLKKGMFPFMVVASAGTTNTGVIDPLDMIADVAEKYDLWFHIDAAYGGFFLLLEQYKSLFKGVERSDSFTIDPHKGLFLSYGLGAILIKNVEAQYQSFVYSADYLQDAVETQAEPSPADLSPELTKHFRGLRMWLSLQILGVAPFKAALEEKILLCRYFHQKIQELGFEVGPVPSLSITIYRYVPNHLDANTFNQKLIEYIQKDGRVFLSSTAIDGIFWIRLAVLSFRAHLREVDLCLTILQEGVQSLLKES